MEGCAVLWRISVRLVVPVWHLCSVMEATEEHWAWHCPVGRKSLQCPWNTGSRQHTGSVLTGHCAGDTGLSLAEEGTRQGHPCLTVHGESWSMWQQCLPQGQGWWGQEEPQSNHLPPGEERDWCDPARLPPWPGMSWAQRGHGTCRDQRDGGTAGGTPGCWEHDPEVAHPGQSGSGQSVVPGL